MHISICHRDSLLAVAANVTERQFIIHLESSATLLIICCMQNNQNGWRGTDAIQALGIVSRVCRSLPMAASTTECPSKSSSRFRNASKSKSAYMPACACTGVAGSCCVMRHGVSHHLTVQWESAGPYCLAAPQVSRCEESRTSKLIHVKHSTGVCSPNVIPHRHVRIHEPWILGLHQLSIVIVCPQPALLQEP